MSRIKKSAIGRSALSNITTGNDNTAIGYNAGFSNITGSSNTYIGSSAGSAHITSDSNNIDIANVGVAGESGVIRIGNGSQVKNFQDAIRGVTTDIADAINVLIDSNGQLGTVCEIQTNQTFFLNLKHVKEINK